MALEAIRYSRAANSLSLLDQRLLPGRMVYAPIANAEAAHDAIVTMLVRGAPAIAICAALALAVELQTHAAAPGFPSGEAAAAFVAAKLDYLVTSRPTAVNLSEIAGRLKRVAAAAAARGPAAVVASVVDAAEGELQADLETNKRIGQNGARALAEHVPRVRVLTHCNTGSLATAGYGTALGVVRALASNEALAAVYATETRPYNQGARLTAFELVHDGLQPATLIADSAAAALMAAGEIDAVVVGADRVAANGDTANKIGTYSLAVAAHHHGIPFYVAAPVTTLDPATPNGASIHVEQRAPEELTHFRGERVAAEGIAVWNPSFDVTPAALISGIITEESVLRRDALTHTFPVAAHVAAARARSENASAVHAIVPQRDTTEFRSSSSAFYRLDAEKVLAYVAGKPKLAERMGGLHTRSAWTANEVGDGNINYIYRLEGPGGALILKQALPFIRMIGASWPLSQDRIKFEAAALMEERRCCPAHVPEVYLWDEAMAVIAMQYIEPPHEILRGALVAGRCFPSLASHMAEFLASTLFNTSALALRGSSFRRAIASYANVNMCELTEQVVFTDPFYSSPFNSHTSPQLDDDAAALRSDVAAKAAATALKRTFMESTQALLHGDLHTGSVLVKDTSTFVIDCEFSFYGPMGFDVGAFLGNLLLAFFAADGHEAAPGERAQQRSWLLSCIRDIWVQFVGRFKSLWTEAVTQGTAGEACPPVLFGGDASAAVGNLASVQDAFLAGVLRDALGFAGCKMARRIVGVAHVADFTRIADVDVRASCERRALRFGRRLLVHAASFSSIDAVVVAAEEARTSM